MKIVVIGGTGLIGAKLVTLLRGKGQEVVAASPRKGVDTITGEGLADALRGAAVVVDVSNAPSSGDRAVLDFFLTSTRNLLAAEGDARVMHHVALSIVGAHRLIDSGYMRAKTAQEDLIKAAFVPYTIVESTQFFEFIEKIARDALRGDVYRVSPALMQPVLADEVVAVLGDIALGPPQNDTIEVAGPDAIPLVELVRQLLRARHEARKVVSDRRALYYGAELNDQSLIPGPMARIGATSFSEWLPQAA